MYSPQLYDVITTPKGQPLRHVFLVMEFQKLTLHDFMRQDTEDFTAEQVIVILYNMLCAVHRLHTAGVLHRDLKPQNILLNERCQVKVCDFGLARPYAMEGLLNKQMTVFDANSSKERSLRRRAQSLEVQTRWYRSPEVIMLDGYD